MVDIRPRDGDSRSQLGVVLYHNGNYAEAKKELHTALELLPLMEPYTLQYLAMTEWQLGDRAKARDYYDQASAVIKELAPSAAGFNFKHAEVTALLGI